MEPKPESKYERLRKIGIGSYGVVFKCVNRQTGQIVAIKRYSENDSDPTIRKIAMREVRMLRQLRHPNLIRLIEVFRRKHRLHLVFDYCELTMLDVIEKYANNCPLNLIKKITWQTVNGINYCHRHNCIHRDIKPENILINQFGVVKLCDFGFARNFNGATELKSGRILPPIEVGAQIGDLERKENGGCGREDRKQVERQALTEYVATRWYRAPELLIGDKHYDTKIDIWAIGCVTAELMRGEPIWPGKTDLDQLCIVKNSLGSLTMSQTHTLLTQATYDQGSIEKLINQSVPPMASEVLEKKLPVARIGQKGLSFVNSCLRMDPAKRLSSDELLKHDFIWPVRMTQFMTQHAIRSPQVQPVQISSPRHSVSKVLLSAHDSNSKGQQRSNSQCIIRAANQTNLSDSGKVGEFPHCLNGADGTSLYSYSSALPEKTIPHKIDHSATRKSSQARNEPQLSSGTELKGGQASYRDIANDIACSPASLSQHRGLVSLPTRKKPGSSTANVIASPSPKQPGSRASKLAPPSDQLQPVKHSRRRQQHRHPRQYNETNSEIPTRVREPSKESPRRHEQANTVHRSQRF